jgi:hypothetical protein
MNNLEKYTKSELINKIENLQKQKIKETPNKISDSKKESGILEVLKNL